MTPDLLDFPPLPSQARDWGASSSGRKMRRRSETLVPPKRGLGCAASINDLPNELILEILEYLPFLHQSRSRYRPLLSISLANRRLHALVADQLYNTYDGHFFPAYTFLRTILSNEQLAQKVRSLTLTCKTRQSGRLFGLSFNRSSADKKIIKEGLRALNFPGWKEWACSCNDQRPEQETLEATILMHTPKVTSLEITEEVVSYKVPKWLVLIRWAVSGIKNLHQFSLLKSISVEVRNLKLRHLAPVFKLQSLKSLTLIGLMEGNMTVSGKAEHLQKLVPAASSGVENLILRESFIDTSALIILISFVKVLRNIEYMHTDGRWWDNGPSSEKFWIRKEDESHILEFERPPVTLDYPALITALDRHRCSLNALSVGEHMTQWPTPARVLGSLCKFEKLTHLDVPFGTLVNLNENITQQTFVENMPRSLRRLEILVPPHRSKYDCLGAVAHMVASFRDFVPLLEEVRIRGFDEEDYYPDNWESLLEPLLKQGVHIYIDEVLRTPSPRSSLESLSDDDRAANVGTFDVPGSEDESDEESLYSL